MKNYPAASRFLICAATLIFCGTIVQAQALNTPDTPPAYAVAQRLVAESASAKAAGQRDTAHNRAYQAVAQLEAVVKSKKYGHTVYARESLRQQANLQEYVLQDKNAAIQSLQTLHNTFPDDTAVVPEIKRVGGELDKWNSSFAPPPAPPFHNVGAVLYRIMDRLVALTGRQSYSYFFAILLISILVKLLLTPLSNKQYGSMKEMQKLQPYIQGLQAKHKNDKELLGRKMMELYKEHKVNPAAGCLPLLVQLPVMYLLYYMIRLYQYQFSYGSFLWIGGGLAHQFPTYLGINLGQPDIPILLLYAGSMYITQRMTVTPTMDPQQAETQRMMAIMTPFMTTYFFLQAHWPSAFVLYYFIFNILSVAQQKYYMRKRAGEPDVMPITGALLLDDGKNGSNGKNGNGTHTNGNTDLPVKNGSDDKFSRPTNGTAPAAKGIITPSKVHPKKKRR